MKNIFSILICLMAINIYANDYRLIKNGPVHEAYIVQEYGALLLQSISQRPPEKISELVPERTDSESIWLPGYWDWSPKHESFLWVSGLWRRPPPGGKNWIAGDWIQTSGGWTRLKGFWSAKPLDAQTVVPNSPPDLIDEKIAPPPKPENTYFWIAGYWFFDEESGQFVWNPGKWSPIQSHWIYCPPQYIWREEGYIFNPAYWDWPLEERGLVYSAIFVEPQFIKTISYEPQNGLNELYVLEHLFPYWPNYCYLFHYHYFFHHDLWQGWGAVPTWWEWPTWWCFPWQDLWGLWWWWCHPGYPSPVWLDARYAEMIAPPPEFVIEMMGVVPSPPYVTPNGVVGLDRLLKGIKSVTGRENPILPYNPNQKARIENVIRPATPPGLDLKPTGTRPVKSVPLKPTISRDQEGKVQAAPQRERPLQPGRERSVPPSTPEERMRPMPTVPSTPAPSRPIPQQPERRAVPPSTPEERMRPMPTVPSTPAPSRPIPQQPERRALTPSFPEERMRSMPTVPTTPTPTRPIPQRPIEQPTELAPFPEPQTPPLTAPPGIPHQGHRLNEFPQRSPMVHQPYPSAVPPAPIPQKHYGVKGYPQQSRQAPQAPHSTPDIFYDHPHQGYPIDRHPRQPRQAQHLNKFMNQHKPQQNSSDTVVPNLYDGRYPNIP